MKPSEKPQPRAPEAGQMTPTKADVKADVTPTKADVNPQTITPNADGTTATREATKRP